MNIFISTSGTTARFGSRLKAALQKAGYGVFLYTEDIKVGSNWHETLRSAIEQSDKMIALLSPTYLKSPYCMEEYDAAFQDLFTHPNMLFPVMVETTSMAKLQRVTQYCDVTKSYAENDWEPAIVKILRDLQNSLNTSIFSSTIKRMQATATNLLDAVGNTVPLFKKKEYGIVIASLVQTNNAKYDVAADWLTKMENQFEGVARDNNIRFALSNTVVTNEEQAKKLLKKTKAAVVVWGQISGNIRGGFGEIPELIRISYTVAPNLPLSDLLSYLLERQIFVSATDNPEEINFHKNRIDLSSFSAYLRGRGDLDYLVYCLLGFLGKDESEQITWFSLAIEKLKRTSAPHAIELNIGLILTLRAWCYFKTSQYEESALDADSAINTYKQNSELAYLMITISHHILNFKYDGEARILLMPEPSHTQMLQMITINTETGEGLSTHGEISQRWLNSYLEFWPDSPIANFLQGFMLEGLSEYNLAIDHYQKALDLNPALSVAHYQLGNAYQSLGKQTRNPVYYDHALIAYSNALRSDPTNAFAYFGKGLVFELIGHKREAIRSFDKAIELKPQSFAKGFGLHLQDSYLYEILNHLLRTMYPSSSFLDSAYLHRGTLFYDQKLYAKAIQDLQMVKKADSITAQFFLGHCFNELEKWQDGIKSFTTVINKKGENLAQALIQRAWAHYQLKNNNLALKDMQRAEKLAELSDSAVAFLEYLKTHQNL